MCRLPSNIQSERRALSAYLFYQSNPLSHILVIILTNVVVSISHFFLAAILRFNIILAWATSCSPPGFAFVLSVDRAVKLKM